VASPVNIIERGNKKNKTSADLFDGLPDGFMAGRYHSWVIDPSGFPESLEITATDSLGHIMALRHKTYDVLGVQFHPESVLTPDGEKIMRNWLVKPKPKA
jgi:anthranilate synthase component 2